MKLTVEQNLWEFSPKIILFYFHLSYSISRHVMSDGYCGVRPSVCLSSRPYTSSWQVYKDNDRRRGIAAQTKQVRFVCLFISFFICLFICSWEWHIKIIYSINMLYIHFPPYCSNRTFLIHQLYGTQVLEIAWNDFLLNQVIGYLVN